MRLTVHEQWTSLVDAVDIGLGEYNAQSAPLDQVRLLIALAQDDQSQVLGGAVGRTWGRCAELQQLWVAPSFRKQGLGRALLQRFHQMAKDRGCDMVYLETFSFQAPRWYGRFGYQVRMHLDGYAHGIEKFWMVCQLPAEGGHAPESI